jgi:hypothetical protein
MGGGSQFSNEHPVSKNERKAEFGGKRPTSHRNSICQEQKTLNWDTLNKDISHQWFTVLIKHEKRKFGPI